MTLFEKLSRIPSLENTIFYSPLYGNVKVELDETSLYYPIVIRSKSGLISHLTKDGYFSNDESTGEIMLYPSRDEKSWSNFIIPREDLPINTPVLVYCQNNMILAKYNGKGKATLVVKNDLEYQFSHHYTHIVPVNKYNYETSSFKNEDDYGSAHEETLL